MLRNIFRMRKHRDSRHKNLINIKSDQYVTAEVDKIINGDGTELRSSTFWRLSRPSDGQPHSPTIIAV